MTIRTACLLPLALAALAACAPPPLSPEEAEAACRAEIARDPGVRTNVGIGIGSGGPRIRTGVVLTDAVLNPRSPERRLEDCIARRVAGRAPPPSIGVSVGGRL